MKRQLPLATLCLALAAAPALAGKDCDVPVQRWQSRDAVLQYAARQGWQVQRLKIDDGCYEIRGRDAQGRAFKAKLDPETLNVLKMKQRDDQERSPHDKRGKATPAPDVAPASSAATK
ncbi:MAG: PepSY domain-containing protein [Zoogloeaceae bacterium]|nr:PepSY domain-containing protein [Zoogloeaceae bacterium]